MTSSSFGGSHVSSRAAMDLSEMRLWGIVFPDGDYCCYCGHPVAYHYLFDHQFPRGVSSVWVPVEAQCRVCSASKGTHQVVCWINPAAIRVLTAALEELGINPDELDRVQY